MCRRSLLRRLSQCRSDGRELRVDVAFGGVFHAIVDTEAIGIPLDGSRAPELQRLGIDVLKALNADRSIHASGRQHRSRASEP